MNILVYLAFLIFYLICFCFMYVKNTELISLCILFFITAMFITYVINNIFYFFTNDQENVNFYISSISLSSSFFGLIVHFIGLLLIIATNFYLQYNSEVSGDPIYLSSKYQNIMSEYKQYFILVLSYCFLTFFIFFLKEDYIKTKSFSLEFTLCILAVSLSLIIMSYYQFNRAVHYSKLRQKDYMMSPQPDNGCSAPTSETGGTVDNGGSYINGTGSGLSENITGSNFGNDNNPSGWGSGLPWGSDSPWGSWFGTAQSNSVPRSTAAVTSAAPTSGVTSAAPTSGGGGGDGSGGGAGGDGSAGGAGGGGAGGTHEANQIRGTFNRVWSESNRILKEVDPVGSQNAWMNENTPELTTAITSTPVITTEFVLNPLDIYNNFINGF